MKKIIFSILIVITLLLVANACVADLPLPDGDEPNPVENPDSPAQGVDPLPPIEIIDPVEDPSDQIRPFAAIKALKLLAEKLDLSEDQIEISKTIQVDWSDSCLGLGGPAESCLAAITPGWQVTLLAESKVYIARTDEQGDSIRFEDLDVAFPVAPPLIGGYDGSVPQAAVAAQEHLAVRLNISVEAVEIVSYQQTDWPDGCLGLAEAGMMCTMAIVPGWRVELSADGQSFIARTNETGSLIKFE